MATQLKPMSKPHPFPLNDTDFRQLLPLGQLGGMMAGFNTTSPERTEQNKSYGMNYIIRGQARYSYGEHNFIVGPGSCIEHYQNGVPHAHERSPDFAECYVTLQQEIVDTITQSGLIRLETQSWHAPYTDTIPHSMCELINAMRDLSVDPSRLLIQCLDFIQHCREKRHLPISSESRLQRARTILASSLDKPLRMHDVAEKVGIAYSTFNKRFHEHMGVSPTIFRICKKIERARFLLQSKQVQAVAAELGYAETSIFTRQFKQHVGMTPRAYQRILRYKTREH